jgi:hypothetical protein
MVPSRPVVTSHAVKAADVFIASMLELEFIARPVAITAAGTLLGTFAATLLRTL